MSSFSSNVVGDRKPGFTELKARAMTEERMQRFAKLPPLNIRPNMQLLNVTSESDPLSTEGSTS